VNASCNNTKGGYNCSCKDGYTGDGQNCADIDECAKQVDSCDAVANSECKNTNGSYNCQCKDGFVKNGLNCEVDVCHWQNYQNLSDAERKHDYETQEGDGKCDETLNGWYRFRGAAGTKMLTTCPPLHRCDAAYPIWLSGGHPTVAEGKVTRNVCINKLPCCKESFSIHVKNCSSYYIYKLGKPTGCPARYCSTD